MRTEYDVIETPVPQQRKKSKRERRHEESKRLKALVCAICKHSDVDHQAIHGVDKELRYCHACNDKCPYDAGRLRRMREARAVNATPADLGRGDGPVDADTD